MGISGGYPLSIGLRISPSNKANEVFLRMSHMFSPILTNVFNHWLAQGAIPGSITKGVITLQKKEGRHVRGGIEMIAGP